MKYRDVLKFQEMIDGYKESCNLARNIVNGAPLLKLNILRNLILSEQNITLHMESCQILCLNKCSGLKKPLIDVPVTFNGC